MSTSNKPKRIVMYSPEWRVWITGKHLKAVDQLQAAAVEMKKLGEVGQLAADQMQKAVDILNAEPIKKED